MSWWVVLAFSEEEKPMIIQIDLALKLLILQLGALQDKLVLTICIKD